MNLNLVLLCLMFAVTLLFGFFAAYNYIGLGYLLIPLGIVWLIAYIGSYGEYGTAMRHAVEKEDYLVEKYAKSQDRPY